MEFFNEKYSKTKTPHPTLILVIILVGVGGGLSGMSLALLLHYIQHIAYGYSPDAIISNENFLMGVRASSPERRILILTLCGFIAGLGWWVVYRYGKPLMSIADAVKSKHPNMPMLTTTVHVLLQVITIALGSPLGREVAPRELSAIFAGWLSSKAGLSLRDTQIMLACAAGAGLAAVYNVPFSGAMYCLEVLLCTLNWSALLPALATSAIAVVVSWIGLGNEQQYHILDFNISYSLITWSIITGPIFGFAAYWFIRIATLARRKRKENWQLPVFCVLNFMLLGLLAIYFPPLLGNGKSAAVLAFSDTASIGLSGILLVLRTILTWSSLRAGAEGGLLTPSLANGALLAVVLGGLWGIIWPDALLGAYALVGAAAFLAAAQKMPITAIILLFELTRIHFNFLIPILFAVAGAVSMFSFCSRRLQKNKEHSAKTRTNN